MAIGTANEEWLRTLEIVKTKGQVCSPRGLQVREVRHHTTKFQMKNPVVWETSRKLSYKFMAAEALWILHGSKQLDFHPEVRQKLEPYSDDGLTMAGAYGIQWISQSLWCINKLIEDRDSRQAVVQIWTPKPEPSKDIPCTCTMQFMVREDVLHTSVFMRSSDVWMGLPYDMFSFTMMSQFIAVSVGVALGVMCITAGSSHLYESNVKAAEDVLYGPRLMPEHVSDLNAELDVRSLLWMVADAKSNKAALDMLLHWRSDE